MTPDLNRIRGWLLVCLLALIPHTVGSFGAVFALGPEAWGGHYGLFTLLVTGVGNLLGIVLILTRHRWTPAFFMVYIPLLVTLNLLYPDLLAVANARFAAAGAAGGVDPVVLRVALGINIVLAAMLMGHWTRSRRVLAVFGTRGLDALRNRAS